MQTQTFDLVIVGSGSTAFAAAIRAHVAVHQIGHDQEGFIQFYEKQILLDSTAGKRGHS
jgi:thioredoxin reductase